MRIVGDLSKRVGREALLLGKAAYRHLPRSAAGVRLHVFVAGVQRSGTNLVMDLLERSIHTDVYHERDARAFDHYEMRSLEVIDELVARCRGEAFVIKALCELQDLGVLMDRYTPSRTVWIVRNWEDVVNSMIRSFRNFHKQVLRIARDRTSDGWRSRGMSDETHQLLKAVAHEDISEADGAALHWYFRNVLFFEQGLDRDERVLALRYEGLVAEPRQTGERLFAHLDLPFSERITRPVFGTSVGKRPPPIVDPSIRSICDRLAERFEAIL